MPLIEKRKTVSVKLNCRHKATLKNVGYYINILAHVASSIEMALESTSKARTQKQVEAEQAA
jgi:hypothetical protein